MVFTWAVTCCCTAKEQNNKFYMVNKLTLIFLTVKDKNKTLQWCMNRLSHGFMVNPLKVFLKT